MSSTTLEWLTVLIFFLGFFAFTLAETFRLSKKGVFDTGRAFLFSFVTNILCVTVGFFVSFVIFGVIVALTWDGSLQKMPSGEAVSLVAVVVSGLFPPFLLTLAKRLMIAVMKPSGLTRPLLYSFLASLSFYLFVISLPIAFVYLSY